MDFQSFNNGSPRKESDKKQFLLKQDHYLIKSKVPKKQMDKLILSIDEKRNTFVN